MVNFQSQWPTNVEMTVAGKLCVQRPNMLGTRPPAILNVYGMHSAWRTAVIKKSPVCLWCQIILIITVKFNLNRFIAH